jgi:hypothetical protein
VHTRFIEEHLDTLAVEPPPAQVRAAAAVAAFVALRGPVAAAGSTASSAGFDPWDALGPVRW